MRIDAFRVEVAQERGLNPFGFFLHACTDI
jgi:hypothetical protein